MLACLLSLAFAAFPLPAAAIADSRPTLSLPECLDLTAASNPELKAAADAAESKRADIQVAFAGFLPTLDLQSSNLTQETSNFKVPSITHSNTFIPMSLTLAQNLYDFGKTNQGYQKARHDLEAAQWTFQGTKSQVELNVKTAFINMLRAQQTLEISDKTIEQRDRLLQVTDELYKAGVRPRFDVARAQIDLANARLSRVDAETDLRRQWKKLETAVGADIDARPLENILTGVSRELDEDSVQAAARSHRPEILSQKEAVQAQRNTWQKTRRDYLPTAGATASFSERQQSTVGGVFSGFENIWSVGVNAKLNLFSGLSTYAAATREEMNLQKASHDLQSLERSVSAEVYDALLDIAGAAKKLKLSTQLVELAQENASLSEELYRSGKGTIIEITDAQSQLLAARLSRLGNLADYHVALAKLERVAGVSLDGLIKR